MAIITSPGSFVIQTARIDEQRIKAGANPAYHFTSDMQLEVKLDTLQLQQAVGGPFSEVLGVYARLPAGVKDRSGSSAPALNAGTGAPLNGSENFRLSLGGVVDPHGQPDGKGNDLDKVEFGRIAAEGITLGALVRTPAGIVSVESPVSLNFSSTEIPPPPGPPVVLSPSSMNA